MSQIFDQSRGCLPVTAYLILVSEDTTVTVGEGACSVTITAAEGQRVVWTDSTAKLTLSTDSARYEQLPKSAPLPVGQGGTPLSPAEQEAVENLAAGTISHSGSLNVHAASILTYGAPIDTIGGDVYHRDGSATFAGTEGGHDYAAVIDFKHFEVRKDGQLIVHFHESNNEPVLELGGKRVLTEADETLDDLVKMDKIRTLMEINAPMYSSLAEFGAAHGEEFVNGESVYAANMSRLNMLASETDNTIKKLFLHIPLSQKASNSVKPKIPNADATIVMTGNSSAVQGLILFSSADGGNSYTLFKSLTAIFPDMTSLPGNGFFSAYGNTINYDAYPIKLYLPKMTDSFGQGTTYAQFHLGFGSKFIGSFRDIKVYAPVMNKTSFFYARGIDAQTGARIGSAPPLSAESVAYLFTYLPTVTGSPTMHTAIAKNVLIAATQAEVDAGLAANIGDKCPQAGTPLGNATKSMLTKGWLVDFDESTYE